MKVFVSNIAIFVVLAFVLSSLTGCSGTTTNTGSGNQASVPNPPRIDSDPNKASLYPLLPATFTDTQMEMLDGSKSRVGDHKGKALILNLWAIWCGPCRDEMPHLAAFQKQYGSQLEVISLNLGDHEGNPEPIDNIKKFAAENKIDYTLGRISQPDFAKFITVTKQTPIPQTVMVDRDGRLRGVIVGGGPQAFDSMAKTLEKMINEG